MMAKVKVSEVKQFNKLGKAHFEGGTSALFWLNDAYAASIVSGAELDVKVEERPNRDDANKTDRWIVEVNGQGPKAGRSGGGGGGGYKGQPKDDEAIVAQVIIKEACETARANATRQDRDLTMTEVNVIASGLVDIYRRVYLGLKEGK
jgi:hypothetical protein